MKYISILRGINVSGQKKIKMEELQKLYESLVFDHVQTYIQSGNVIFGVSTNDTHDMFHDWNQLQILSCMCYKFRRENGCKIIKKK